MNRVSLVRLPVVFLAGMLLGTLLFGIQGELGHRHATTFAQDKTRKPQDLTSLAEQLSVLKGRLADQSHAMTDIDYHFSNLYFAGKAQNWPLAAFYWQETMSHLRWAVRIIPIRKDLAGHEIRLGDILQSIEQSPWMQIGKTIEAKDVNKFETAYRYMVEGCYTCHKAAGKPYLRPHIPTGPASAMINFDPRADWPR